MDMFSVLFVTFVSFLLGVIITLVVQYYILYSYFKTSPVVKPPERHNSIDYSLPESLKKQLEDANGKSSGSLPVSLILQFLFHELRHSESIKRWLYKKLSLEFEELLTKTTIGKFFDSINIKDMNLGSQFPDIKDVVIEDVKLDKKEGHIDSVSLCLNLDYTGNFLLSIDAKMKFGKTAYLSITVKRISGHARLQFTRDPYTHWSFSFYQEPIMELAVESHFQGRQLQSNITNLIVNQIKKAIKRKHTLPNYKIRYKPFFNKTDPSQLDLEDNEIVPQGQLEVTCMEVTRLEVPASCQNVYCTVAVDTIPWICLYQNDDDRTCMLLEITMTKLRQAQLGVIFKQDQPLVVMVESVSPHGCASRSGLKPGDVVLAVENRAVQTVPQVAKFIKSISSANITLRVERPADTYNLRAKRLERTLSSPSTTSAQSEFDDLLMTTTTTLTTGAGAELTQTEQDSFVIVSADNKTKPAVRKLPSVGALGDTKIGAKIIPSNENMSKLAQTIGNFSLRKRKTSASDTNKDGVAAAASGPAATSGRNTPNSSGPGTPQHTPGKLPVPVLLSAKKHSISELPEIIRNDLQDADDTGIDVIRGKELPCSAGSVLVFNDDFQFGLRNNVKYLNINVWGTTDDRDVLLGYLNIPLSHVLNECCNSVLGHYMRTYSFLPPWQAQQPAGHQTQQHHPLMAHSGFEHVFCYGDVLLSFIWAHDDDIELKRKLSTVNPDFTDVIKPSSSSSEPASSSLMSTKHDFIRTQFHRTTHCDFCSKKIWLKDAVQCRECGMSCHKKCIVKCQMSSGCNPGDRKSDMSECSQPEITMSEACDDLSESETTTVSPSNMKRVNSVNNLAIPGGSYNSGGMSSRSLPQSPARTPSRKQSIANINPFALCPSVLDEVQKQPNDAPEAVAKLLEQVMLCPPDETLMDAAKESGQQLYVGMPHEERVEKINLMMTELKKTLDSVTNEHMELSKQMNAEESEAGKAKLAFLMGQADAKVHGLSVLMLHYCSSLQHTTQEKII